MRIIRNLVLVAALAMSIVAGGEALAGPGAVPAITSFGDWRQRVLDEADLRFSTIAAGRVHACGVRVDGALRCWGGDTGGDTAAPDGTFIAVAAGDDTSCAVRTDGVRCWGADGTGLVSGAPSGSFVDVAVGRSHACATKLDDTLVCWGAEGGRPAPVGTYRSISMGWSGGCAIALADETIRCWSVPTTLATPPPGAFRQLSVSDIAACGVRTDSSLTCWGSDNFGQVSHPGGVGWAEVGVSQTAACARRVDGRVACWGLLHDPEPPDATFDTLAVGGSFGCGLQQGAVRCWGDDHYGQVTAHGAALTSDTWAYVEHLADEAERLRRRLAEAESAPTCNLIGPPVHDRPVAQGRSHALLGRASAEGEVRGVEVAVIDTGTGQYYDGRDFAPGEHWLAAKVRPDTDGGARWSTSWRATRAGTFAIRCRATDTDGRVSVTAGRGLLTVTTA